MHDEFPRLCLKPPRAPSAGLNVIVLNGPYRLSDVSHVSNEATEHATNETIQIETCHIHIYNIIAQSITSKKQHTHTCYILVRINTHRIYTCIGHNQKHNWYAFGGTKNVPLSFLLTENESSRPEAPSSPTYATRRCVCAHPWCAPSGRLMGVCLFVFFSGPTPKDRCIYDKRNAHNKERDGISSRDFGDEHFLDEIIWWRTYSIVNIISAHENIWKLHDVSPSQFYGFHAQYVLKDPCIWKDSRVRPQKKKIVFQALSS